MKRNRTNRRGVVLLVILGMLALFMLIVVSYVMTASAEKRGAMIAAQADQAGDPPDALMHNTVLQVVRGARSPDSVIGPHSLLEDMYGERDSIAGAIGITPIVSNSPTTTTGASDLQIIELTGLLSFGPDRQPGLAGVDDNNAGGVDDVAEFNDQLSGSGDRKLGQIEPLPLADKPGSVTPVDGVEGYYAGRVITMLDGPAAKHSTRIIRWWFDGNNWKMWIRPFANGAIPEQFNRFVINGRPFNGAGFGFTGVTAPPGSNYIANDFKDSNGFEFALLPNPTDPQYRLFMDQASNPNGVDADEDYDIANWDNMALACRMYNEAAGRWQVRIPSFHRPELLPYWRKRLELSPSASWTEIPVEIRRRINLRPDPQDHVFLDLNGNGRWDSAETWSDFNGNGIPEGGGSGPLGPGQEWLDNVVGNGRYDYGEPNYATASKSFNGINGPWDVDNDGDGEPDSVWIDAGFPVQTAADGRQYKPLVAVLCLDLDGRINLNAHGNPTHYKYTKPTTGKDRDTINTVRKADSGYAPVSTKTQALTQNAVRDEVYVYGMTRVASDDTSLTSQPRPTAEPLFPNYQGGPYAGELGWINNGVGSSSFNGRPFVGVAGSASAVMRNQVATGLGFSPAEINLAPLMGLPGAWPRQGGSAALRYRYNWYRFLLEGRADGLAYTGTVANGGTGQPGDSQPMAVPGRYGEMHLINPLAPGFGAFENPYYNTPPRAGITYPGGVDACDDNLPTTPAYYVLFNQMNNFRGNLNTETSLNARNCPPIVPRYAPPYDGVTPDPPGTKPEDSRSANQLLGHYGSPTDVFGQVVIGIGFNGQPVYGHQGHELEAIEDPWELDLSQNARRKVAVPQDGNPNFVDIVDVDAPLTAGELEYILRGADPDVMITNRRIHYLMWEHNLNPDFRNRVTTEQWDLPCPNVTPTPEIAAGLRMLGISPTNLTVGDLVRGKLAAVFALTGGNPQNQRGQIEQTVRSLMDPRFGGGNVRAACISADLIQGLRMDINRPFGNGMDDTVPPSSPGVASGRPHADYVVDDPEEARFLVERLWGNWPQRSGGIFSDFNRDGLASPNGEMARQTFARHMYFLMMLLTDTQYLRNFPTQENIPAASGDFDPATEKRYKLGAYKLAQWAINTVDFRDRDAINTYFEFDICPFTQAARKDPGGWDVDGVLGKDPLANSVSPDDNSALPFRGLVWGAEYPELLITETTAFHDRRVADTDQERPAQIALNPHNALVSPADPPRSQAGKTTDTAPKRDGDWDQARLPQGSLFIELYCTGKSNAIPQQRNNHEWYTGSNAPSPGDPNLNYLPRELYNTLTPVPNANGSTSYGALDLGRMAPAHPTYGRSPVWRLAISKRHLGRDVGSATVREILHDPAGGTNAFKPDTSTMQPERFNRLLDPSTTPLTNFPTPTAEQVGRVELTRFVWFGKTAPLDGPVNSHPDVTNGRVVYYNRRPSTGANDTDALLQPSQYAVIGPARQSTTGLRNITYLGYTGNPTTVNWTPQKIDLDAYRPGINNLLVSRFLPTGYSYPTIVSTATAKAQIKLPLCIPCGRDNVQKRPSDPPPGAPLLQGLNVSEPVNGYAGTTAPTHNTTYADTTVRDTWGDNQLPDIPFEEDPSLNLNLFSDRTAQPGTYIDYCTVFLQRLANPLMAWNPAPDDPTPGYTYDANVNNGRVNPYITVDWMPIDLTIFNGQIVFGPSNTQQKSQIATNSPPTPRPESYPTSPNWPSAPQNYRRVSTPTNNPQTNFQNTLCLQTRQRGPRYIGTTGSDSNPELAAMTGMPGLTAGLNRTGAWPVVTGITPIVTSNEATLWPAISDDPQFRREERLPPNILPLFTSDQLGTFRHALKHSLGFVNTTFGQPVGAGTPRPSGGPWLNRDSLDINPAVYGDVDPLLLDDAIGAPFGAVHKPFPWLTWNNRPYANAMELLLVPSSSQARLTTDFTYKAYTNQGGTSTMQYTDYTAAPQSGDNNHYNPNAPWSWGLFDGGAAGAGPSPKMPHARYPLMTTAAATTIGQPATTSTPGTGPMPPMAPFGHLLNFFPTSIPGSAAPGGGDFHRILEYVHVPSKFSGTEEMLSPFKGQTGVNGFEAPTGNSPSAMFGNLYPFHAPFNRVSRYREPGKININTMFDAGATMWNCVTNNFPDFNQQWGDILASKLAVDPRGPDGIRGSGDDIPQSVNEQMLNPDIPTFFPNPFRSFSTMYNVPLPYDNTSSGQRSMLKKFVKSAQAGFPALSPAQQPLGFVDSNLLRRVDPVLGAGATAYQPEPLMVFNSTLWSGNAGSRLPGRVASRVSEQRNAYRDPDRNPYFRYQPLIKTGSMLTTRSNVYAIWVTLGYFEVNRVQIGPHGKDSHPDGFKMVRELGSDAGDVRRYRMFAIFDRSIPVAFQRGENYNVEKAFLMKRIVE